MSLCRSRPWILTPNKTRFKVQRSDTDCARCYYQGLGFSFQWNGQKCINEACYWEPNQIVLILVGFQCTVSTITMQGNHCFHTLQYSTIVLQSTGHPSDNWDCHHRSTVTKRIGVLNRGCVHSRDNTRITKRTGSNLVRQVGH